MIIHPITPYNMINRIILKAIIFVNNIQKDSILLFSMSWFTIMFNPTKNPTNRNESIITTLFDTFSGRKNEIINTIKKTITGSNFLSIFILNTPRQMIKHWIYKCNYCNNTVPYNVYPIYHFCIFIFKKTRI